MSGATQSGAPVTDLSSAASTESTFQNFFEAGAFNSDGQLDDLDRKIIEGQDQTPRAAEDGDEQAPAPESEQQDEAPQWATFDDFLTASKAEREKVLALPVTLKIDGVDKQVPLSEVLKINQLEGHVNNKSIALSQERQAWENERAAVRQAISQQVGQARNLGNAALTILNHDFQQIDWNGIRAQDPARFAALRQDFQDRQAAIGQFLQGVEQQQAQMQQQQQQEFQQRALAEKDLLLNAVPEWRDVAKAAEGRETIVKYARNLGFSEAELGQVTDHRVIRVLRDAAQFAALQAQAPQAVNKVRAAPPKTVRPGTRTNAQPGDASRADIVERFKANPKDPDAQAAMFELYG